MAKEQPVKAGQSFPLTRENRIGIVKFKIKRDA
jgi:hypothetical protein